MHLYVELVSCLLQFLSNKSCLTGQYVRSSKAFETLSCNAICTMDMTRQQCLPSLLWSHSDVSPCSDAALTAIAMDGSVIADVDSVDAICCVAQTDFAKPERLQTQTQKEKSKGISKRALERCQLIQVLLKSTGLFTVIFRMI